MRSQKYEFTITDTAEPHARRRHALLARYPSIRSLFGYDRRTAWVTMAAVAAQFALALSIGHASRAWWLSLFAAYAIGAPITHWLAMAIHETSHRLAWPTKRGNVAVALLANAPMVLPFAMTFHRYHLDHHKRLNVLGEDTDLPLRWEIDWIGNSRLRKLVAAFLHPLVYLVRGSTFAKLPNRGEIANGVIIIAIDIALYRYGGATVFAYLALSFYFALGLHPVAGHFIHEHYAFAKDQETFSYYGPLNWISFNVGYHNEHHDFMGISGWRLPKLTGLVPDYRALVSHSSWSAILWRFITDPKMTYASRIVRLAQPGSLQES